jgi:DNA-binding transcriptional MerR regulator
MNLRATPFLSPAETSKLLGVSIKALRLYEQHGLLSPLRSASGWRTYGPEQMARLHQILALKALGLSLKRIAELLRGSSLAEILEIQERALRQEHARVARALKRIRLARKRINAGNSLSLEDVVKLGKEAATSGKFSHAELEAIFEPIIERYFSRDERQILSKKTFDKAVVDDQWAALISEAKYLIKRDNPTSEAAKNLARRWRAMIDQFTGGDPDMFSRAGAVWKHALADPAVAPRLPLNSDLLGFIGKAMVAAGL